MHKYQVSTRTGINQFVEANSPVEAIKKLSDKKVNIKPVKCAGARSVSNVMVILTENSRQSINHYLVTPIEEEHIQDKESDKYKIMNQVIDQLLEVDTGFFIDNYVEANNLIGLKYHIEHGYIPFKVSYGTMQLSLIDGKLMYEGSSMAGTKSFYKKIQDILKECNRRIAEDKMMK